MKTFQFCLIKTIFLGLIFCNGNLFAQTWPPTDMQGNGTEDNPWQITTPVHLEALANYVNAGNNGTQTDGIYYILMNDINLSGYAQGEGWIPIGYWYPNDFSKCFQGYFNGNGY